MENRKEEFSFCFSGALLCCQCSDTLYSGDGPRRLSQPAEHHKEKAALKVPTFSPSLPALLLTYNTRTKHTQKASRAKRRFLRQNAKHFWASLHTYKGRLTNLYDDDLVGPTITSLLSRTARMKKDSYLASPTSTPFHFFPKGKKKRFYVFIERHSPFIPSL